MEPYNKNQRKNMTTACKEFKLEAIWMCENGEWTVSEVERELGITAGLLLT